MKKSHSYRVIFLGCIFLVCAISLGIVAQHLWVKPKQEPEIVHGTVLSQPRPMPEFSLEGTEGYPIDIQHLQGHWTFLFMGFSHCASVCPLTMAELAKMSGLLQQTNLPSPWVVMITLDPKRDSIERMHNYVRTFNPNFLGARGAEEEVKKMAQFLGIAYTQIKSSADNHVNDYSIEHSGAIMLLNPNGDLVAFFTPPHHADWLAKDYQNIVKQQR
ncbi:MAG: SCO family protein [Gammaproteobacteria bacterium]